MHSSSLSSNSKKTENTAVDILTPLLPPAEPEPKLNSRLRRKVCSAITTFMDEMIGIEGAPASVVDESRKTRLRKAALACFSESLIALGCSGIASAFIPPNTSRWLNPLLSSSVYMAFNLFTRLCNTNNKTHVEALLRWARSFNFAMVNGNTAFLLLHEGAHAWIAHSLFKNADPKIMIKPSVLGLANQGVTSFNNKYLSEYGKRIGRAHSKAAVSAAGSTAEVILAMAHLIVAQAIPQKYTEIRSYLRFSAILNILFQFSYALSPYRGNECKDEGNDFCKLEKDGGIPPAAAAAFILGSALILQILLSCITRRCRTTENKVDDVPAASPGLARDKIKRTDSTTALLENMKEEVKDNLNTDDAKFNDNEEMSKEEEILTQSPSSPRLSQVKGTHFHKNPSVPTDSYKIDTPQHGV